MSGGTLSKADREKALATIREPMKPLSKRQVEEAATVYMKKMRQFWLENGFVQRETRNPVVIIHGEEAGKVVGFVDYDDTQDPGPGEAPAVGTEPRRVR